MVPSPDGGSGGVRSTASSPRAGGATAVVPAPPRLPPACLRDGGGWNDVLDAECYFAVANETLRQLAADPRRPFCYGVSGLVAAPGRGHPLLFHTAALTGLPPTTPLLLHSFLATQCCDAELWFWLPASLLRSPSVLAAAAALPPHQAHRVVWKVLDLELEWAAVAADFPRANASTARAMGSWEDLRFTSDWVRVLIMYSHGGTWFDLDTVFLADLRPLVTIDEPSFAYPAGWGPLINNAGAQWRRGLLVAM